MEAKLKPATPEQFRPVKFQTARVFACFRCGGRNCVTELHGSETHRVCLKCGRRLRSGK